MLEAFAALLIYGLILEYWYILVLIALIIVIIRFYSKEDKEEAPYTPSWHSTEVKQMEPTRQIFRVVYPGDSRAMVSETADTMFQAFDNAFDRLESTALSSTNIEVVEKNIICMRIALAQIRRNCYDRAFHEYDKRCRDAEDVFFDLVAETPLSSEVRELPPEVIAERQAQRKLMTPSLRMSILRRDGNRCCICGRNQTEDSVKLEVDHIMPVSKGGKTVPENLQTLCFDCNRGKSDKWQGSDEQKIDAKPVEDDEG